MTDQEEFEKWAQSKTESIPITKNVDDRPVFKIMFEVWQAALTSQHKPQGPGDPCTAEVKHPKWAKRQLGTEIYGAVWVCELCAKDAEIHDLTARLRNVSIGKDAEIAELRKLHLAVASEKVELDKRCDAMTVGIGALKTEAAKMQVEICAWENGEYKQAKLVQEIAALKAEVESGRYLASLIQELHNDTEGEMGEFETWGAIMQLAKQVK